MMKILITGGTGLLGRYLIQENRDKHKIAAIYFGNYNMNVFNRVDYYNLDIRDKKSLKKIFDEFNPDVVVHSAGITNPDYAEKNKECTWEVNISGTRNIVFNCEQYGSKFIYISSHGIYDGEKGLYEENDKAEPLTYYGRIKLEGEKITKNSNVLYAIVRPSLMYGWTHPNERVNIAALMLKKIQNGETVFLYEDVFCNPLSAEYAAKTIWRIIEGNFYDVFNIGGADIVSIYQFMKMAAEVFGLDTDLVRPVSEGFFEELVKRPKDTSYNIAKMNNILKMKPLSLKEGLEIMRANIL